MKKKQGVKILTLQYYNCFIQCLMMKDFAGLQQLSEYEIGELNE